MATEAVMREPAAKYPRLAKAEFPREVTYLLLIFVDEFTARLAMHAGEPVANRPYPATDTVPRFNQGNPATSPFELASDDKPR